MTDRTDRPDRGAILALGFGTTVAMWAVGYATHLPGVNAPAWLVGLLLVGTMLGGGYAAGRSWTRGWRGGLRAGLLTAALNLLVLGSLLASSNAPNAVAPSALLWLPGSFLFSAGLGAAGAALGARKRAAEPPRAAPLEWTPAFAWVAVAATLLLLGVGGLVTSHGAGLAVVDWPNSFGYNMFLYPLSRMTGGIYYEHAHRLFGALVGLTTLVLAVHLWRTDDRAWLRRLGVAALGLVIVQGVLGGLRVTGRFTLSASAADTAPSTPLAVVHGVTGQVFFALLCVLAIATTRVFREARPAPVRGGETDRGLAPVLFGVLLLQLILGAVLRHHGAGLIVHISMACVVFVVAMLAGLRAWGFQDRHPALRRAGAALMVVTGIQLLLGLGAVAAVGAAPGAASAGTLRALLATPHQVTGAVLLGLAAGLAAWTMRTVERPVRTETAPAHSEAASHS